MPRGVVESIANCRRTRATMELQFPSYACENVAWPSGNSEWQTPNGKTEDGEWKTRHLAPSGVAFNAFLGVN